MQADAPSHLCPQLADVVDSESLQVYMKPPAHEESKAPSKGFVVRDAPWTANSSEKVSPAVPCAVGAPVGGTWPSAGEAARAGVLTKAVPSFPCRLRI